MTGSLAKMATVDSDANATLGLGKEAPDTFSTSQLVLLHRYKFRWMRSEKLLTIIMAASSLQKLWLRQTSNASHALIKW